MKRRIAGAPLWAKIAVPVLLVGGLGYLGSRIGQNTVSIGQLEAVKAKQAAEFAKASVAACRSVQHTNLLQDRLIEILNTGTRAASPIVQEYVAAVRRIEADTRLCDLAARRVGHPIRPAPLGTLPDNR